MTSAGTLRRAAVLLACCLLLCLTPAPEARAETAADARRAAEQAAAEVDALQPRVGRALQSYERALDALAHSVSLSVAADAQADAAARLAQERARRLTGRVRALYMSGGSVALYASVLDAGSPAEAMRRVAYVQRLVQTGATEAAAGTLSSEVLEERAGALEAGADAHVVTASDVARRHEELTTLLAEAGVKLSRLSSRARTLEAAEAAAARLAALAAAAARDAAHRVATATAAEVPAAYRGLYVAAARTCEGLSWTVLAAIGQVESGHGRNTSTSYAGAQGPMQFLPSTFAAYGVDGDGDGDTDIQDPTDAVFSAARYLCANGAGRGGDALYRAVWHYNHADWYVQLVLRLAAQLEVREAKRH